MIKIIKVVLDEADLGSGRIYFFKHNESIIENLMGRHNRPINDYANLLPDIAERTDIDLSNASWSQTAGCDCGCSPGFIVSGMKRNINVDYEDADEQNPVQVK